MHGRIPVRVHMNKPWRQCQEHQNNNQVCQPMLLLGLESGSAASQPKPVGQRLGTPLEGSGHAAMQRERAFLHVCTSAAKARPLQHLVDGNDSMLGWTACSAQMLVSCLHIICVPDVTARNVQMLVLLVSCLYMTCVSGVTACNVRLLVLLVACLCITCVSGVTARKVQLLILLAGDGRLKMSRCSTPPAASKLVVHSSRCWSASCHCTRTATDARAINFGICRTTTGVRRADIGITGMDPLQSTCSSLAAVAQVCNNYRAKCSDCMHACMHA